MQKLTIVLGCDNVGKSTYIDKHYSDHHYIHFDAPSPTQMYWHTDYDKVFEAKGLDIVCDRGFIEAAHYQFIDIKEIIRYYNVLQRDFEVDFVFLKKPWSARIAASHVKEIKELNNNNCQQWYIDFRLKSLLIEHNTYNMSMQMILDQLADPKITYITKDQ